MNRKYYILPVFIVLIALMLSACSVFEGTPAERYITASGTISAETVDVSPEISGKVVEVAVKEGQQVAAGEFLFRIDDEILKAQYNQAIAAVEMAKASQKAAEEQLNAATLQALRAEQGARLLALQNGQITVTTWSKPAPDEFKQPYWYYQKSEAIRAAKNEVEKAQTLLDNEQVNLENVQAKASNDNFIALEQDLANMRARFQVAEQTLQQSKLAKNGDILQDMAQKEYDSALADLETYQRKYDQMLTSAAAEEVLEARAKLAVSIARLENAKSQLDLLQTGENSLDVQTAQAAVSSAGAQVEQAKAGLVQAEAAVKLIEIQLNKTTVTAAVDGTIMVNNLQVSELAGAGSIAMAIGMLKEVSLVVYVPEDAYGRIQLNQKVSVSVDSYPGKTYSGEVIHISDQAEFTPRNVQTVEGRKATVYAIKIRIPNPNLELKPGMPADVDFGILLGK